MARLPTSSSGPMGSLSRTSPGALSHVESRISHQPCFRNDLTPKIGLERFLPREDIVSAATKQLHDHKNYTQRTVSQGIEHEFCKIDIFPGVVAAKGEAHNPQHRTAGGLSAFRHSH